MTLDTLILGQRDVDHLLRVVGPDALMDRMIDRLQHAFAQDAVGHGITPARDGFRRCQGETGVLEWMPHREPQRAITIKTVAYTPHNPAIAGLPTILGTLSRYDDHTGRLTAIADGVLTTAIRTGAASAIASRLLAHPDSDTLGLIGAGAQAVTQLHAISRVLRGRLRQVLVYDINRDRALSFGGRTAFMGLNVTVASPQDISSHADIICTATSVPVGGGPVFEDVHVQDHVHVNAVGADLPGKTELPHTLLRRAFVCPDHLEQARKEGECQQLPEESIGPTLSQLCATPELAEPRRGSPTVFDSTGFALEDHVALDVLIELAEANGCGQRLRLERLPLDALNPYGTVHAVSIPPGAVPMAHTAAALLR